MVWLRLLLVCSAGAGLLYVLLYVVLLFSRLWCVYRLDKEGENDMTLQMRLLCCCVGDAASVVYMHVRASVLPA